MSDAGGRVADDGRLGDVGEPVAPTSASADALARRAAVGERVDAPAPVGAVVVAEVHGVAVGDPRRPGADLKRLPIGKPVGERLVRRRRR